MAVPWITFLLCQQCLLTHKNFKFSCSPICFFLCCLCLQCHIQEIIVKSNIVQFLTSFPLRVLELWSTLFFIWCWIWVQFHTYACRYLVFSIPVVESTVLSPSEWSWHSRKKYLNTYVKVYFWALFSIPSVLMPVPYYFDYCNVIVSSETTKCRPFSFIFLFQDFFLDIQGFWDSICF